MENSFVAVVLTVPKEYFHDGDDLCLTACRFVCVELGEHLARLGHSIPNWIQGGCDEDWGVYFESMLNGTTLQYYVSFFPSPRGDIQNQIMIQYQVRRPLLRRLLGKSSYLPPDHSIHETMRSFGDVFGKSRMLTKSQFDSEY